LRVAFFCVHGGIKKDFNFGQPKKRHGNDG
jgi:hypothetical protein